MGEARGHLEHSAIGLPQEAQPGRQDLALHPLLSGLVRQARRLFVHLLLRIANAESRQSRKGPKNEDR